MSTFGKRLKSMRIARGYRQHDLASLLDCKRATISAYELGKLMPPYEKMKTLSDFLGTTPSYLMGETDDPGNAHVLFKDAPEIEVLAKIKGLMKEIQEPLNNVTINRNAATDSEIKIVLNMLSCTMDVAREMKKDGKITD